MPAASSMKARWPLGSALRMASRRPLAHDDVHLLAQPRIAQQLLDVQQAATAEPLMAYSEPPLRQIVREIVTSV